MGGKKRKKRGKKEEKKGKKRRKKRKQKRKISLFSRFLVFKPIKFIYSSTCSSEKTAFGGLAKKAKKVNCEL